MPLSRINPWLKLDFPVFLVFGKLMGGEGAQGHDLAVFPPGLVHCQADQLLAKALSVIAFLHFGVVDDQNGISGQ